MRVTIETSCWVGIYSNPVTDRFFRRYTVTTHQIRPISKAASRREMNRLTNKREVRMKREGLEVKTENPKCKKENAKCQTERSDERL